MNIALISGAYKNAGDFLIEERCRRLLLHLLDGTNVHKVLLNDVKNKLHDIREMDAVVFHGGPIYVKKLEGLFKGKINPNEIAAKSLVVGGGWYGKYANNKLPFKYNFSDYTMNFWKNVDMHGYGLGCRDLYTLKCLKNKGLTTAVMTGCPAWYNLGTLHIDKVSGSFNEIKNIFVSEPANKENFGLLFSLIKYLNRTFQKADITIVVHKDKNVFLQCTNDEATAFYKNNNINIVDITNSCKGFSLYDDSDLHIGFRVHAHIYNLSMRKRSILVEEDGRGAGVNEALGLIGIKAYDDRFADDNVYLNKIRKVIPGALNTNLVSELDSYLDILNATDDRYINNAFLLMQKYYQNMERHILRLKNDM